MKNFSWGNMRNISAGQILEAFMLFIRMKWFIREDQKINHLTILKSTTRKDLTVHEIEIAKARHNIYTISHWTSTIEHDISIILLMLYLEITLNICMVVIFRYHQLHGNLLRDKDVYQGKSLRMMREILHWEFMWLGMIQKMIIISHQEKLINDRTTQWEILTI